MKIAHYIASTHWDREWYETFQNFRWRLVQLLDEVLTTLEGDPSFESFEMDGQIIPIDDYLEIRPGSTDRVRMLAAEGRLRVGPWFVLPDEWLVSGESLIRNLELGLHLTNEYGAPRPLTAPVIDEFGHVSQIPQVLRQFGFLGTFLHRGINLKDCGTNFWWGSPDGSVIRCHRLAKQGYGSLQIHYRRVLEPDEPFDFAATVDRLVEWTRREAGRSGTGPILLLDSCDHVEIEPQVPLLLAEANRQLADEGICIRHSDSDTYMKECAGNMPDHPEWEGELRMSARDEAETDASWLISGVLSSRVALKQANARCEDELCLWAEPFDAFARNALRLRSNSGFLELAWRYLLENHAHDSICGCSIDQVHKDMEFRFDQCEALARRVSSHALKAIAHAAAPTDVPDEALVVTLFNPTAREVDGPVDFEVRLPSAWPKKFQEFFGYEEKFAFRIQANGQEVEWQLNGQTKDRRGFRRPYRKIPAEDVRHLVDVTAPVTIPPFGFTTLVVTPVDGPVRLLGSLRTADRRLENEHLTVEVGMDGTIRLTHKATGRVLDGLFAFEESADIGDGWNWCPPVNNEFCHSAGANWSVSVRCDGPEKATLRLTRIFSVPEEFDFRLMKRSDRHCDLRISTDLTLRRGSHHLEARIEVDNAARDHRLRVKFPTELSAETYWADSAFDAVERSIALESDNAQRRELDVDGRPQQTWTALGDGKSGLGVICRGLYESGVEDRADRPLFLTLLRGFRRAVFSNDNPGGQSLGRHEFSLRLLPFSGGIPFDELFHQSQSLSAPVRAVDLLARQLAGRTEALLSTSHGFLKVEGPVVVTSLRISGEAGYLLRFFNPSLEPANFQISSVGSISQVSPISLSGHEDQDLHVSLLDGIVAGRLEGKKIATLRVLLVTSDEPALPEDVACDETNELHVSRSLMETAAT